MLGAAQRYEELRFELLLRRTLARGKLPQAVEADFAAELQRCWEAMTDEEQEHVENALTSASIPSTAADLAQQDEHVPDGSSSLPRSPVAA